MSDLAVTSSVNIPSAAYPATAQASKPEDKKPAPKVDVIDLSKPPTSEQAERLRSAGILGYGSVSASKTTTPGGIGSSVHFTVENQGTYFDLVNQTTVHHISSSSGVFTSNGPYALNSTIQLSAHSWDNSNWTEATLQTSAFKLNMSGSPSWIVPSYIGEDGTIHLAQLGSSAKVSISGWHAVFSAVHSSGGQTLYTRFEGSALKTEITVPSTERPAGAVDHKNESFDRVITSELLDRINKYAQTFRSFDIKV